MDSPRGAALRRAVFWLTLASAVAPLFSIAAAQTLLALSLLCLLLMREKLRLPPIALPLALFLGGTVVALLLSGHIVAGWPQVRKFYVFLLVPATIATVFRGVDDALRLLAFWTAGAAASALLGLAQFGQRLMAARRAGEDLYQALVGHRITGFMSLWMTFGGQLMIVLLMVLAWLMFSPERSKRWMPAAGCAAVIALALVLALTRGPWFGAAAGVAYLLWQWNKKALLAAPLAAALALLAAPATVRERVVSIARPRSELDSNRHRIVLWRTGLEMVKAHPWFGVGPEQVDRQFERYVPADIPRPLPWGWYHHLHNTYLQYAAERGIPVLLMFLWLAGRVLGDLRRAASRQPPGAGDARAILHGAIAAIVAVLVAGVFEHNLGDSEMLQMFLTVIAIGYAAAGTAAATAKGSLERDAA